MRGDGAGGFRRLLIATGSMHKLAELRAILDLPRTELLGLADVGLTDTADETGSTFEANATIKALHYAELSGLPTLADDSGLEVDALGGRPGVQTRRYAGPSASDAENNAKLLGELAGVPPERRTARYQCVLVLVEEGAVTAVTRGAFEGRIALEPRGSGGFGYDPLFEPPSEPAGGRTVADLDPEVKNAISHRAQAARTMRDELVRRGF